MKCSACSLFQHVSKGGPRPLSIRRSVRLILTTQCLVAALLTGCLQPDAVPQVKQLSQSPEGPGSSDRLRFVDHTDAAGINFTFHSGAEPSHAPILEEMGGGCGLLDFDLDGCLDAFFPGGGCVAETGLQPNPSGLFQNLGHGTFRDASKSSGLMQSRFYSQGVASADCDADGFPDLLVTGYGGLQLFKNQGDGTFVEQAAAAGLTDRLWSTSAAWGDVNGDGNVDLYVCHYVDWSLSNDPVCEGPNSRQPESCPPNRFHGLPDTLYLSQGTGTFADISKAAGLRNDGKGLGVVLCDLDADHDVDIYVANDTDGNFLYRNDGHDAVGIPRFTEVGLVSGASLSDSGTADGSMGVAIIDLNQDSRPDLWVCNFEFETPGLYRNEGGANFTHVAHLAGLASRTCSFVSFGVVVADFDGDRDDDVLVANGHVSRYPASGSVMQPCQLFENLGGLHFLNVEEGAGECLTKPTLGRGLAVGDIDGDGDPDAVASPKDAPVRIYRNSQTAVAKWLRIQLVGTRSARDGRGAVVTLIRDGIRTVLWNCGGSSYLSSNSLWFCLPAVQHSSGAELEVTWPSGRTQRLDQKRADVWTADCGKCRINTTGLIIEEPR